MNPEDWKVKKHHKHNKLFGPFILIIIGIILLLQRLPLNVPEWVFSWNTILIVVGLVLGAKSGFRHWVWFGLILLGVGNILSNYYVQEQYQGIVFPAGLIVFGIFIFLHLLLFKRHNRWEAFIKNKEKCFSSDEWDVSSIDEDNTIHLENTFGGVNRNFISKNFNGGYIKNTFGGIKVDLTHCDFEEKINIYIDNTFGGITFYIPANWKVISQVEVHLSGIDDKTYYEGIEDEDTKYLFLKGKSVLGGIELKSF